MTLENSIVAMFDILGGLLYTFILTSVANFDCSQEMNGCIAPLGKLDPSLTHQNNERDEQNSRFQTGLVGGLIGVVQLVAQPVCDQLINKEQDPVKLKRVSFKRVPSAVGGATSPGC